MSVKDWLFALQVKDIASFLVWAAGVVAVIVEFNSKIPFHPLSRVVRWMGKILNQETWDKLDEISVISAKNQEDFATFKEDVSKRFDAYEKIGNQQKAVNMRNLIINFAENLRQGRKYSVKQFERIFEMMSDYHAHCEKHNIKNHYIDEEHDYIREMFRNQVKGKKYEDE